MKKLDRRSFFSVVATALIGAERINKRSYRVPDAVLCQVLSVLDTLVAPHVDQLAEEVNRRLENELDYLRADLGLQGASEYVEMMRWECARRLAT